MGSMQKGFMKWLAITGKHESDLYVMIEKYNGKIEPGKAIFL